MTGALFIVLAVIMGLGILPLFIYLLHSIQGREPEASETLDAEMTKGQSVNEPFEWWEARRSRFNRGLALAGMAAMMLYYVLQYHEFKWYRFSEFQFNWLFFCFQLAAYMVYMGLANLIYNLGLILESMWPPVGLPAFRLKLFGWLYGVGVGVPVVLVVYLILAAH